MPGSVPPLYIPSTAFIALCQSHIRLLQQGLQVDWCGVYSTQGEAEQGVTLLAVSQPPTPGHQSEQDKFIGLPRGARTATLDRFSVSPLERGGSINAALSPSGGPVFPLPEPPPFAPETRLVLPLIYEKDVMGVLIVDRVYPQWQPEELNQLEAIANSLAIACLLDQQQDWYRGAWEQQLQQRQWEQRHWADLLHQLRNPLTALKTFSKLLLKRWQGDEKDQQVVEGIVRQGEHLQELLQGFEAFQGTLPPPLLPHAVDIPALPAAEGEGLSLTAVDLGTILGPILLADQAIAAEKDICLMNQLPGNLPRIQANGAALREIFSNLIDNALKYTPMGGSIYLTNVSHESSDWVGVAIADTGYGIPPQDQAQIFERHYRGCQADGPIAGTGLGLAIVKDLVQQMQGKIDVLSPNGLSPNPQFPGTTFTLWLRRC